MKHSTLILLMLTLAAAVWVAQRRHLLERRHALLDVRNEVVALRERIGQAESELTTVADGRRQTERERDAVLARTVTVEGELAREDPGHYWVEPPAVWPSWNPESPYVWLPKEELGRLRAPVFTDDGRLRDGVPDVLVVDRDQVDKVNALLPGIVGELRALEVAHAVRMEEPLPGIVTDGPHLTIQVSPFPEEAGRLRRQFESVLNQQLGEQRAGILLESGAGWMNQHFNVSETEAKTYSVVRHPNGTFNLSIKSPQTTLSMGGNIDLSRHIPGHLLGMFAELMGPAPLQQADHRAATP